MAVDATCTWGCFGAGDNSHCGALQPSGGAVTTDDLSASGVAAVTITGPATLDSDAGTITGVTSGFAFNSNNGAGVFRFRTLTINGPLQLVGNNAVALVAAGELVVNGVIDARGGCVLGVTRVQAGPGGFDGGNVGASAPEPGGGGGRTGNREGGGGGGYGGNGGLGSGNGARGASHGDPEISMLVGGGGGGGGKDTVGGGGGGAVQLVSNTSIEITQPAGINAGGCGGGGGAGGNDGGGGGGAGGAILLEAPVVTVGGILAANGGSGGNESGSGGAGRLDTAPATISGGNGGAANTIDGGDGGNGEGGGGAIGRLRVNTRNGQAIVRPTSILSPAFTDIPTRATQGTATVR